jgi:catechol 2,3-dioxygenase-like lactoylglutathione lyase family enzyme
MPKGMHHLGLATHDMETTLDFYENVLGFPAVVCEMIEPEAGGAIRHAFFDAGNGELVAFMECNRVEGVAEDFDAGINRGLGTGSGLYHFAFKVDDEAELELKRTDLVGKGVKVRGIVDHGWCKSIYFRDPNHLQLEFCCMTEDLGERHRAGRFEQSWSKWARR